MDAKDSFIFSLKNGTIQNSILSKVKDTQYAISNRAKKHQKVGGPIFGDFSLYSEKSNFALDTGNYCDRLGCYYEKPIRISSSNNFSIANYEVFRIVRKSY